MNFEETLDSVIRLHLCGSKRHSNDVGFITTFLRFDMIYDSDKITL
jgi:glutathionyl-hydroquinone reductase